MTALGVAAVALGVALLLVAAVGLARLPDAFTRANAVTKAAGLGVVLVLVGAAVLLPTAGASVRALIAVLFQLLTVPVAGYAVARAAQRAGTAMSPCTRVEESPCGGHRRLPGSGNQEPADSERGGG